MKKRTLLAMILSLVMCLGIAMPAWAAEETNSDGCSIKAGANETSKVLEDANINLNGENKQVMVNIVSSTADKEVQQSDIINAYNKAMTSYRNDMHFDSNGKPEGTFNYTLVGADEIFFYEQTADSPMQAEMDVVLLTEDDKMEMQKMYAQKLLNEMPMIEMPFATNSVSYHARMEIYNSTVNPSQCVITLPDSATISAATASSSNLYIYSGFSGGFSADAFSKLEADLGLVYQNPDTDVWKCFMTITATKANGKKVTEKGIFLPNRQEATYMNGYMPGQDITIVCVPNNQSVDIDNSGWGSKGSIVLKAYGLARYADRNGNGGPTQLTSIMESNTVYNLESVNYHKWVTAIGGSGTAPAYNVGIFNKIAINNQIQNSSKFEYSDDGDGEYNYYNIGNGTVSMYIKRQ